MRHGLLAFLSIIYAMERTNLFFWSFSWWNESLPWNSTHLWLQLLASACTGASMEICAVKLSLLRYLRTVLEKFYDTLSFLTTRMFWKAINMQKSDLWLCMSMESSWNTCQLMHFMWTLTKIGCPIIVTTAASKEFRANHLDMASNSGHSMHRVMIWPVQNHIRLKEKLLRK